MQSLVNTSKYQATYFGDSATGLQERAWSELSVPCVIHMEDKTRWKKLARQGIPDSIKHDVYSKLLGIDAVLEFEKNFDMALKRTHGNTIPDDPMPPTFGGKLHSKSIALSSPAGIFCLDHTLCILAFDYPNLDYSPYVPALTAMLAHHLKTPDDVLGAMSNLISLVLHPAAHTDADSELEVLTYFPGTRKQAVRLGKAFGYLLSRKMPRIHTHLLAILAEREEPIWYEWLSDFFIPFFPQPLLWRVLDAFIVEGFKTLFRVGIAILQHYREKILASKNIAQVLKIMQPQNIPTDVYASFLKSIWNVSFSRHDFDKPKSINAYSNEEVNRPQYLSIRSTPKMMDESSILEDFHWIALWSWIPINKRSNAINLMFTTLEHGHSLTTLLSMTAAQKPMLLVIKTLDKSIFGAYLSDSWPVLDADKNRFIGCGETFLFTIEPFAKMFPWVGRLDEDNAMYGQTPPEASMFIMSNGKEVVVGGGGGEVGLWLNESLTSGTTGCCCTFMNKPLTGASKRFECAVVEVFTFTS